MRGRGAPAGTRGWHAGGTPEAYVARRRGGQPAAGRRRPTRPAPPPVEEGTKRDDRTDTVGAVVRSGEGEIFMPVVGDAAKRRPPGGASQLRRTGPPSVRATTARSRASRRVVSRRRAGAGARGAKTASRAGECHSSEPRPCARGALAIRRVPRSR